MRKIALMLLVIAWTLIGSSLGRGFAQQTPAPPYDFKVFTDLIYYDGPGSNPVKHRLDLFVPEGLKEAPVLFFVHGGACPMRHAGPNKPPFLVTYAEFDFPGFGLQARQLTDLLKQHGNEAEVLEIPAVNHITIITNIGLSGDPTTDAMLQFLRAH